MKLTIKRVICDPESVIKRHGLENGGRVTKFMASEVARLCDPYVPVQSGSMKNRRFIGDDYVRYPGPYAHFQYVGKVMIGSRSNSPWARHGEPKVYTNRSLTYNGAPTRGPEWDKRMMIERGSELVNNVAKYAGGKPK